MYKKFFQSISWWEFVPDHSLILEGGSSGDSLNVAMSIPDKDQLLVYLSEPSIVTLNINNGTLQSNTFAEWTNPKTGEKKQLEITPNMAILEVQTPTGWEDALLMLSTEN